MTTLDESADGYLLFPNPPDADGQVSWTIWKRQQAVPLPQEDSHDSIYSPL